MNNKRVGFHSAEVLLKTKPEIIKNIYISSDRKDARVQNILKLANFNNLEVQEINKIELNKLSGTNDNQGILVIVNSHHIYGESFLEDLVIKKEKLFLLILDEITDPHNVGSCLRTSEAVGIDAIIVPKHNSSFENLTIHKVSCGASDIVPLIKVTNLSRIIKMLKDNNVFIVGTSGDTSNSIYEMNFKQFDSLAIVMGNEGTGMRRLTKENCDALVKIPMLGIISSLNIAVSTGICLFEIQRQKLKNNI